MLTQVSEVLHTSFPFLNCSCEKPLKTFKLRASNELSECLSFTSVRQPSISGNKSALESLTSLSTHLFITWGEGGGRLGGFWMCRNKIILITLRSILIRFPTSLPPPSPIGGQFIIVLLFPLNSVRDDSLTSLRTPLKPSDPPQKCCELSPLP